MSPPPELQRIHRQEREQRELKANNDEEEDASSDEEMRPGALAVAGVFTGLASPSVLSEPRGPYTKEPSLIIAELAEPYQEDEELRQRNQDLEQSEEELRRRLKALENVQNLQNRAVTATVIVENSVGGDHDQTEASSPFGTKGIRFSIGAALVLLLVVGVIVGVTISLTTNKDNSKSCILDIDIIDCKPKSDLLGDRCDSIPICTQVCQQRPFEMSFRYNGGDCSQSNNSQPVLFECNDFNGGPPSEEGVVAYIQAFELEGGELYFRGLVPVGEAFRIEIWQVLFEERTSANMNITIYDPKGETDRELIVRPENIMQTIKYHSSCSRTLSLNDKFGSAQLVEFVNEYQGRVTCFIKAILALDIQPPILTNGDGVRLTSLKMLTNIFGVIDKTENVNGIVINDVANETIPIEITLDLTVYQNYTFFTTIVGETVTGGDECSGDNFFELVA
jgi:hypothetical protein